MHGVRLNLSCDHAPQLVYTKELLGDHVCPPWDDADLEVTCTWRAAEADGNGQAEQAEVFDVSGLDAYGKRLKSRLVQQQGPNPIPLRLNQPRDDQPPFGDKHPTRAQEFRIPDGPILGDTRIVERTQSDDGHPDWPVSTV